MKAETASGWQLPESCDVAIMGTGPAGAATALALARLAPHSSVALVGGAPPHPVDATPFVREGRALLRQLGIRAPFPDAEAPLARGTRACWGAGEPHLDPSLFCPPGLGGWVDHADFAARLVDAARHRGVAVASEARLSDARRHDGQWTFKLDAEGSASELSARFAVDASGRRAILARRLGARGVRFDRLVGSFAELPATVHGADALVEAHELGFWYFRPDSSGLVAAFATDADLSRARGLGTGPIWARLLRASSIGRGLDVSATSDVRPAIHVLEIRRLDRMIGDGWLAAGDAAYTADFLTSQGLARDLESGIRAAQAVTDYLAGRTGRLHRYQNALEQQFEDALDARRRFYAREGRWSGAPFWTRRQDRVDLDADQLLASTSADSFEGLDMYLPQDQLRLLCSLCASPRLADAVVHAFKERSSAPGHPPPRRRILLALQYLVEQGFITAE